MANKRDVSIHFATTKKLKDEIQRLAEDEGRSVGDYLNRLIEEALGKDHYIDREGVMHPPKPKQPSCKPFNIYYK